MVSIQANAFKLHPVDYLHHNFSHKVMDIDIDSFELDLDHGQTKIASRNKRIWLVLTKILRVSFQI